MKIAEQLVDSSFSAVINAPIEMINIPEWVFNLSENEYQDCSPAHISAAKTIGADGRRMSINIEVIGGSAKQRKRAECAVSNAAGEEQKGVLPVRRVEAASVRLWSRLRPG